MKTQEIMAKLQAKYPTEKEYLQAVTEVLECIEDVYNQHPEFEKARIIERLVEPDRMLTFRVSWVDDNGDVQTNTGYRVQFNNAIGPYKGGLRFHPSVNPSILKFLGFEQTFKNALTTLPMGGGKGGSDFNPKGKSEGEIMRFCQAFMLELWRNIGPDMDVPAGDIGVGGREIGYLEGMYKKLTREHNGVLTGKGIPFGGSLIRPEATGFGAVYFLQHMLHNHKADLDIKGKTVAVSGFGNVSWGACVKATELGAKVVATFTPGKKAWSIKCDIAMTCAFQNEMSKEDAEELIANGTWCCVEVSNMGCQPGAIEAFQKAKILFAPGKAVNAGGVATSGLEMTQNAMHLSWTAKEVDEKLHGIMDAIHTACVKYGTQPDGYINYVKGANIAGFMKVAEAMLAQGVI